MSNDWIPGETILYIPVDDRPLPRSFKEVTPYIFLGLSKDGNRAVVGSTFGRTYRFFKGNMKAFPEHLLPDDTVAAFRQVAVRYSLGLLEKVDLSLGAVLPETSSAIRTYLRDREERILERNG